MDEHTKMLAFLAALTNYMEQVEPNKKKKRLLTKAHLYCWEATGEEIDAVEFFEAIENAGKIVGLPLLDTTPER